LIGVLSPRFKAPAPLLSSFPRGEQKELYAAPKKSNSLCSFIILLPLSTSPHAHQPSSSSKYLHLCPCRRRPPARRNVFTSPRHPELRRNSRKPPNPSLSNPPPETAGVPSKLAHSPGTWTAFGGVLRGIPFLVLPQTSTSLLRREGHQNPNHLYIHCKSSPDALILIRGSVYS
jgi:hypothetical protein